MPRGRDHLGARAAGWVLTPGRRTVTRISGVIDPEGRRAHDAYHRLLRDGVWQIARLWQVLAVAIVERLVAADVDVCLDLDDTLHHKSGRRIEGAGVFRDAVRSARNRTVHALGLNLVVITLRITPPWRGMPIGLPVNARVRRKDHGPTTVELAGPERAACLSLWLHTPIWHCREPVGLSPWCRASRSACLHTRAFNPPAATCLQRP